MEKYNANAISFCKKYNVTIDFVEVDVVEVRIGNHFRHRAKYQVTVKRGDLKWMTEFTGSVHNYEHAEDPTAYDFLACITKHDPGTFEDFVNEFGYSDRPITEYHQVMGIYLDLCKEYTNVVRMFDDVIDELRGIN